MRFNYQAEVVAATDNLERLALIIAEYVSEMLDASPTREDVLLRSRSVASHLRDQVHALSVDAEKWRALQAARMGAPPDKTAMQAMPALALDEQRHAVVIMLYPPEQLRDASREMIREVFLRQRNTLVEGLAEEVYKSYTSDPIDPAAARNVAEALTKHAAAQRSI
jgi:hypothetical protein